MTSPAPLHAANSPKMGSNVSASFVLVCAGRSFVCAALFLIFYYNLFFNNTVEVRSKRTLTWLSYRSTVCFQLITDTANHKMCGM